LHFGKKREDEFINSFKNETMLPFNFSHSGAKKPQAIEARGLLFLVGGAAASVRFDQLGPNARPIIGAKVLTCYFAIRCALYVCAPFNRHRAAS
jgi:hypothetical protein